MWTKYMSMAASMALPGREDSYAEVRGGSTESVEPQA